MSKAKTIAEHTTDHPDAQDPLREGRVVFVRAVTYHYVGRLLAHTIQNDGTPICLVLGDASWVATTGITGPGQYSATLKNGFDKSAEIEPIPDPVTIAWHAIVDIATWRHALPTVAQ